MRTNWLVGGLTSAVMLMFPAIAGAQQIPGVTEATMLVAFDTADALSDDIRELTDFDDFGVPTRDMMGSFGRLSSANALPAAVVAAFIANRALCDAGSNDALRATFPGYDEMGAYLATIALSDDDSTDAFAFIQSFAADFGAPNAGLVDLSAFDTSQSALMKTAIFCELAFCQAQLIIIDGPEIVFIGVEAEFTATTTDPDIPMFFETHTFSSSNESILHHVVGGSFIGVAEGFVNVVAVGNTTFITGTQTVTVRLGQWFEVCHWDETLYDEGLALADIVGCEFYGTRDFADVDTDGDFGGGGGDGIPDVYQINLLAYLLCAPDDKGPAKGIPDPASVRQQFENNLALFDAMLEELEAIHDWFENDGASITINGPIGVALGVGATFSAASTNNLDTTFTWLSLNTARATVSPAIGASTTVTGITEGSLNLVVFATNGGPGGSRVSAIAPVVVGDLTTDTSILTNPGVLAVGEIRTIQATTAGPNSGEVFGNWQSSNPNVVTISQTGQSQATMTAVGVGTATITATGVGSGNTPSRLVSVPACVPPSKSSASKQVVTTTTGALGAFRNLLTIWDGPGPAGGFGKGAYGNVAATLGAGSANALNPIFADLNTLEPLVEAAYDLSQLSALGASRHYLVAAAGVSQEADAFTQVAFNGNATMGVLTGGVVNLSNFFVPNSNAVADIGDIAALADQIITDTAAMTAVAGIDQIRAAAAQLAAFAAAPPTFSLVDFEVYGSSQASGDPLSSSEIFNLGENPVDLTNFELYDAVVDAGGDQYDFVALATGIDLFAAGSPFLSAAGALGLGLLAGSLAFTALRRFRRNVLP